MMTVPKFLVGAAVICFGLAAIGVGALPFVPLGLFCLALSMLIG